MKLKIKLRNGEVVMASSYGYGAVDCRERFHHRQHYSVLEVFG